MRQRISRRSTAALIACGAAAVAGAAAPVSYAQARTATTSTAASGASSLRQEQFAAAAAEFHVPLRVLLGVSYEESLWEAHSGRYNTGGGYGPMNLTDVTPAMAAAGDAGAAGRADTSTMTADPALHTMAAAAKLTGVSPARLRTNADQNIRGGAALLASYERSLTGGLPTDPAAWYGAVARYSQSPDQSGASSFANHVFATIETGASRTTSDGQRLSVADDPGVVPDRGQLSGLHLRAATTQQAECPSDMDCQSAPAASTNYQVADRPSDGIPIRYIVIHDTESTYEQAIATFQDPSSGDAANYVMRSSDGAVTQTVPDEDVAFHAGNYWFNLHAIGIEHEGYAAEGATWYTPVQYQATAELVKYLAAQYGIPLDREHIIGHDDVPGPDDSYVAGMHWDPGPYWDWTYFMGLVGAPLDQGHSGVGPVGSPVTITPDFSTNEQTVEVCPSDDGSGSTTSCGNQTEPSNFVYARTAPSPTAPLLGDPYVHTGGAPGTDEIDDWGSTLSAGQQFVVAGESGDWTAIWYSGSKVWFYNPRGENTTPAHGVTVVSAATGSTSTAIFGSGYPQPAEYPSGLSPSTQEPLSDYSLPAGQAYVATAPAMRADDFFTSPPDTVVDGSEQYLTIQFDHRVALVDSADVHTHGC